jgi:DNA-binding transcriptional MerR regulator
MNSLTIGQVGKKVGFPSKTIRFYEDSGVIKPAKRGVNGYRLYDESVIDQLHLIKQARDLGLPISEIKKLMVGCKDHSCEHTKEYLDSEISKYIALLEQKMQQFKMLKSKLSRLKTKLCQDCNQPDTCSYCCNILHQLTEESKKGGENV